MMKDEKTREIAGGMAKESGEHWESLKVEKQVYWYCRALFALEALKVAGYEARKRRTSNIEH